MKKISLITIFDVANFGTYLQALATAVVLQNFGHKVEIVHYERPFKNTILLRRNLLLRCLYYVYFWIRGFDGILFTLRCRRFVSKYTKITRTYFSIDELKRNPPNADIYLTGSDQVWNTEHNQGVDEAFYLSYAPVGKKKVAYAASIGQDSIPIEYREHTKKLLSQYSGISVREAQAVDLLSDIGIKATHVIDPTLLLDRDQWMNMASKRLIPDKYLLVYSVEPTEYDKKVSDVAVLVAKVKQLKIVSVSNFGEDKRIPNCDIYFDFALPQHFLSLMAYASFVVVSSFHGTAFAINFNRQFLTITPGAYSSRIDSLLELTGLQDRRIRSVDELRTQLLEQSISYDAINTILNRERTSSVAFLRENVI